MLNMDENNNELPLLILRNLAAKHFTGKSEVILDKLLGQLSISGIEEFINSRFPGIAEVSLENFNPNIAKQIDFTEIANHFAPSAETDWLDGFSKVELRQFDHAVSAFAKELLHDVVFPILALEHQDGAAKIHDFIKQILSSLKEINADAAEFCENLDIENVPLRSSLALFLTHGGRIPGFPEFESVIESPIEYEEEEIDSEPKEVPKQLVCRLTDEQVIYLAYILQSDGVIKKIWPFVTLLKSPSNKYVSVVVCSGKKKVGLLLSIFKCLYEKKTDLLGDRYLSTDMGNGLWAFFQSYLVDESSNNYYDRELRKLFSENKKMDEAEKIVAEVINPNNQDKILRTAVELTKNKIE